MTTPTISVPVEFLERICTLHFMGLDAGSEVDELRAILAQPADHSAQDLGMVDAYQGAREDVAIWKRRALEAEELVRQFDQVATGLTVLAALHTHEDGRQRVQMPGKVYDQDAGWGAHVEQLVSLPQAKASVLQAVIRCNQKGAFKACMECGYQDGHDLICKFHESRRAEQPSAAQVPDDVLALGYYVGNPSAWEDGYNENVSEAIRRALEALAAAPKAPEGREWIACSEWLPAFDEPVLLAAEFGIAGDWRIKVGGLIADGTWHIFGGSWTPSHWMPLPAAPTLSAAQAGEVKP